MHTPWHLSGAAALLTAVFALNASAATPELPRHDVGHVAYVSGGIGEDEAARFKREFDDYPLVVEVFRHDGARDEYTADALVKIVDRDGRAVFAEKAEGPFMLVRLPAGDYRVSASLEGRHLAPRQVHVTERGHAKAVFVFGEHAG
jgi:hypothetical protein